MSEVPNYRLPVPRSFGRAPKLLSWKGAVETAMTFFMDHVPDDRPDLADLKPTEDELESLVIYIEGELPNLKSRPAVAALIKSCGLTDDDIAVLFLFKIEQPYPFYRMYNGWMVGNRRDPEVVNSVGPLFNMQYYAVSKLPSETKTVARGAIVKDIPALKSTFDNCEERLAPGQVLSFWSFSSFSTDGSVVSKPWFSGKPADEAIIYMCGALPGVDMEPFKPDGMPTEAEILPSCPAVFKVVAAMKYNAKLHVTIEYDPVQSWERAYTKPAAPKPGGKSSTAAAPVSSTATTTTAGGSSGVSPLVTDDTPAETSKEPKKAKTDSNSSTVDNEKDFKKPLANTGVVGSEGKDLSEYKGKTPRYDTLHEAVKKTDGIESIYILVASGAYVNEQDMGGWTPAHQAAWKNNPDAIRALHECGADLNEEDEDGSTPAHVAASDNYPDAIRALHECGADLNEEDENGWTPAHVAARNNKLDAIRALHECGADLNKQDEKGKTPAHRAAWNNYPDVIRALHECGADLNRQDEDGRTPAHVAARYNSPDVIRALHECGADLNKQDMNGSTPAHMAAWNNNPDVIRALHECGADLNKQAEDGWTPAHVAAINNYPDVIRALHECGADLNKQDEDGRTPAHYAARNNYPDVIRALRECGATL